MRAYFIALVLWALPLTAGTHETAHFRFEYEKDGQGTALSLAKYAETDRIYVLKFLGLDLPGRIRVVIGATDEEFSKAVGTSRKLETWIAGMALPHRDLIVISARGNEVFSAREVFLHELGHIYLHKAIGHHPIPRWFDEGFAMYVSGEPVLQHLKTMMPAAALDNLFSLKDLTVSFPGEPPAVHIAYAESMMFVRHLFQAYGRGAVEGLIRLLGQGLEFDTAFRRAFGVDLRFVEDAFRRSFASKSYLLITLTGSGVLWLVITVILGWVYVRRRQQDREKLRQWEEENARELAFYLSKLSKDQEYPEA